MRYDKEKRIFLYKNYEKFRSVIQVHRAWRTNFKNQKAPTHSTILHNYNKFENTGSLFHLPSKASRPSKKRQVAKIEIKRMITENPTLSLNKLSSAAQISHGTTRTILLSDLGLYPYHQHISQELQPEDHPKRVIFAEWFLSLPD